jgi:hypothetical protein
MARGDLRRGARGAVVGVGSDQRAEEELPEVRAEAGMIRVPHPAGVMRDGLELIFLFLPSNIR